MQPIHHTARNILIGIGALVVLTALIVVPYVLWVGTSNVRGAAGAIVQKNSTGNRIEQQAVFEDLVTTYHGDLQKIVLAKAALKGQTGENLQIAQTNLQGIQQVCIDDAQTFNADSGKYLARDWKSAGLPASLDAGACSQ